MLQLPVVKDSSGVVLPAFTLITRLSGVVFRVAFRWNRRMGAWLMDLATPQGDALLSGVRVRVGAPLYYLPGLDGLPNGRFVAVDTSVLGTDPGLTELGERVIITYADYSER